MPEAAVPPPLFLCHFKFNRKHTARGPGWNPDCAKVGISHHLLISLKRFSGYCKAPMLRNFWANSGRWQTTRNFDGKGAPGY